LNTQNQAASILPQVIPTPSFEKGNKLPLLLSFCKSTPAASVLPVSEVFDM
jgi:hypothetical protein